MLHLLQWAVAVTHCGLIAASIFFQATHSRKQENKQTDRNYLIKLNINAESFVTVIFSFSIDRSQMCF